MSVRVFPETLQSRDIVDEVGTFYRCLSYDLLSGRMRKREREDRIFWL